MSLGTPAVSNNEHSGTRMSNDHSERGNRMSNVSVESLIDSDSNLSSYSQDNNELHVLVGKHCSFTVTL